MIKKIYNQKYKDIIDNIDYFVERFLLDGVLFFNNLELDKFQEWNLMCLLGDKIGFKPNGNSGSNPTLPYSSSINEDHKNTFQRHNRHILDNEIFIEWHLENLHKDSPQVAALWNMIKITCSKEYGKTGFINMENLYSDLSIDLKNFLDNSKIQLSFSTNDLGQLITNNDNVESEKLMVVKHHPYTNKKVLRIPLYEDEYTFSNNIDQNKINEIQSIIKLAMSEDSKYSNWIMWEKNDVVIVDLFVMAHAVKGGFYLGERIFSRIWAYESDPSVVI